MKQRENRPVCAKLHLYEPLIFRLVLVNHVKSEKSGRQNRQFIIWGFIIWAFPQMMECLFWRPDLLDFTWVTSTRRDMYLLVKQLPYTCCTVWFILQQRQTFTHCQINWSTLKGTFRKPFFEKLISTSPLRPQSNAVDTSGWVKSACLTWESIEFLI